METQTRSISEIIRAGRSTRVNERGVVRTVVSAAEYAAAVKLADAAPRLLELVKRALAIETSVTQGQEAELRVGYVADLRAALSSSTR